MSQTSPLSALEQRDEFIARHLGKSKTDIAAMLEAIGAPSVDALIEQTVPAAIRLPAAMPLADAVPEAEALAKLKAIASKNKINKSLIGMGYNDTLTPKVILRNVLENPGWYTAYTPYQAEIAQGRLEALLNYEQMVIDLTGLELSNASLLDEATAAAEAMTFCKRLSKNKGSHAFFASVHCHPQTLDVLRTRAEPLGIEVVVGDERELGEVSAFFGALLTSLLTWVLERVFLGPQEPRRPDPPRRTGTTGVAIAVIPVCAARPGPMNTRWNRTWLDHAPFSSIRRQWVPVFGLQPKPG